MRQSEEPLDEVQPKRARFGLFRRSFAWLFSQQHFHFKLLSGTAAGVFVIILLAGIFLYVTIRNHQQHILRAHTIDVMRLSSLIENGIASLETAHRGFLLSGDRGYTVTFDSRKELIQHRLDDLASLILDSPKQRKRVMKVQEVVQKWLTTVAMPEIKARQSKTAETAPVQDENPSHPGSIVLGNS